MVISGESLREAYKRLKVSLQQWRGIASGAATPATTGDAPPLRAELFSADQMEQHGKTLANAHRLTTQLAPDLLLARLADNEDVLQHVCKQLTAAVKANRRISPAGEWLLDNFYLIEEQIRTAKRHLPKGYSRKLPRLAFGPSAGRPRVYDIALEAISHGDGRVDPESFSRFVAAYQKVTPLTLGELWAIPIMLRLALIENLRRVGARVTASTRDRERADAWADQMLEIAEQDPKNLILVVADMARSNPPMDSSFVAELARRLQGQTAALALPLTWIEQRLSELGLTTEQLVQSETQKQASAQVSISNSVGSLRFLGAMNWRDFVETMSAVELKLREDPAGAYAKMDFATRDRYRHAVEKCAQESGLAEIDIARKAIQLANLRGIGQERKSHVGYYLIDQGLPVLRHAAGLHRSIGDFITQTGCPLVLYLGAIAILTTLFTGGLLLKLNIGGLNEWLLVPFVILLVMCTGQLSVSLVNWLATLLVTPDLLSRMDFSAGIAADCRTLVVVPTMLTSAHGIEELVEALEVRFLANQDDNLKFALLTDFRDAAEQVLPEDAALVRLATERIAELNTKYGRPDADTFFLFHRPRLWNVQDKLWMGFERKRGKLEALNGLLRGGSKDSFSHIVGNADALSDTKYVITLDTDTQLPRDAARQFVGAMAHPLNRPGIDSTSRRITVGYGILQPRVAVSLPGTNRSRYARLFGSEPGIDPYTRAVSDVYQDLFGEASFIGKGIYEVDAVEQTLKGRFPTNRILSHDLLESCYARTALLSDVHLYEEYPSHYFADVSRRHRWIRGDWQIASWLFSRLPRKPAGDENGSRKNTLSMLSQWKIFDNLRRSLIPASLTLLLLLGWTVLSAPWLSTLAVIGILLIPPLIASTLELLRKPEDVPAGQHCVLSFRAAVGNLAQSTFTLACMPFEALFSLDAVLRTHWRVLVSKRHLLEWTPSSGSTRDDHGGLFKCLRTMWIGPLLSIALATYLANVSPGTLIVAGPILFLWALSPAIAWWISRPIARREAKLSEEQITFLQMISRKTWAFFETFVGPDDHWLPPDNFQEHPVAVLAHRTSPTNMGLSILANLTAYDFGYIGIDTLVERTAKSLDTMESLPRHLGHFFNWYDTQSLQPLPPIYISSVDSGNLAGHLLTLRPGLAALADDKIIRARMFDGLCDTLRVLRDIAVDLPAPSLRLLELFHKDLESAYDARPTTLVNVHMWLCHLTEASAAFSTSVGAQTAGDPPSELKWWAAALSRQCRSALDALTWLAPWVTLEKSSERVCASIDGIEIPTLRELAAGEFRWLRTIEQQLSGGASTSEIAWLDKMQQHIAIASHRAQEQIDTIEQLAFRAGEMAVMDFDILYDKTRHLLAIGYNVTERRRDASFYDLLASEARLACFVGIAQGKLPQESWFALGRLLTTANGQPTLLSWSGSMFEYLMPLLVMPTYENTLLDRTYQIMVDQQIAYGKLRGVAWGISECGYNTVDAALNYQYRAFGAPGLGLKRGLADDLVIAPYASALALMVAPERACVNLQRLASEGLAGKFGFYEAIDYTAARLPRGQTSAVIRSFMAHHQGMIFLSMAYLILRRPMQRRFESDPMLQATTLLLQERVPRAGVFQLHATDIADVRAPGSESIMPVRVISDPNTPIPEVQLLSNGSYHVMVTHAGGGYSRWRDLAVTRWHEDTTRDNWGAFCYIRDQASGVYWSNTHQPTLKRADSYEAIFSEGRAEFRRRDLDFDTYTEIVVSPEDDIELRRVHITNRARIRRTIDVTSYAEVVIAAAAADASHPAFSNLFVQTEIIRDRQTILCTRRPRSEDEQVPWMFHLMAVRSPTSGDVSFETDRMRFIGRTRTVTAPQAMGDSARLSDSAGSVLDPIAAIRQRITLEPEQSITIDMVYGVGTSRDSVLSLAGKYQDRYLADRVFELAWTHSQVVLRQINATDADAQLYARLARSVIFANASLRADAALLGRNKRGQSGLWGYAISGDLPIVLLQIHDLANIDLVRQLVRAHAYWRLKGLAVDLMIWNEDRAGYRQLLQDQIMGLIAAGIEAHVMDKPGGIFVRQIEQISDEDRNLIQSVARIVVSDRRGDLVDQINRRGQVEAAHLALPRFKPVRARQDESPALPASALEDLLFDNGLGGFSADGTEYVITLPRGRVTPAPWSNVLANAQFGTVISESGMAYTWAENAHEFRLTPWNNDPVTDASGEALYLRDEESGQFWSPTPLPCRGNAAYMIRHGFGYSRFDHTESGVNSALTVFVALDSAVKFSVCRLRNDSGRTRRLSCTGYVEWVLGDLRPKTGMHVITEVDPLSGALYASNSYNTQFADRVAFFDVDDADKTISGDRLEFIGRNGTPGNPRAMKRSKLSNKTGAALDPCGAIQVSFELAPGEEREVIFRLGVGHNLGDARNLVQRSRGAASAQNALDKVRSYWRHTLGTVQVETPDPSINVLTNGWLLYQTLACRLWARSGYYQSGGAFGFRDQLQDAMALLHVEPLLAREHLLRCAAHQFREGDVQHWWQPGSDRGVRTHCSDDFLWLPLGICRYVRATGDVAILDESVGFLEGRFVEPKEDSYYDLPGYSNETASLYQHGVRAIQRGLNFGTHGLPLMGTGDWNDGMNMVGAQGRGESVWLGFFFYFVLTQFSELAIKHGDQPFAEQCRNEAVKLRQNIERNGWDGEWYRRAYFDDGTPLGSNANVECQIDAIAQSWSVLSGAGDPLRSRTAMSAVDRRLVRRDNKLIQLLDPPFDQSAMNPGYIKGYVPGVRENGGQYTHAAIWSAMAFAELGDSARAWELFDMINPINHASSKSGMSTYKVEPYVIAADVYAVAPHTGRGGWTWYTGSAGWMYRLVLESLLGITREADKLLFAPRMRTTWISFKIHYRFQNTVYSITVIQVPHENGKARVTLDGVATNHGFLSLVDDRADHVVEVRVFGNSIGNGPNQDTPAVHLAAG